MSELIRVAVVAEGPTDTIVLEAVLRALLPARQVVVTQLQPEGSLAFGSSGGGWSGVYRWCRQSAARGRGRLRADPLVFLNHDVLVLHVDADVAGTTYAAGNVSPVASDGALPCEQPCPPASDSVDAMRAVLLSWCGETSIPPAVALCIPSKSMEAWVVQALFPNDRQARKGALFECHPDPAARLGQQPVKQRISKSQADYRRRADDLAAAWPNVVAPLPEAGRFSRELQNVAASV